MSVILAGPWIGSTSAQAQSTAATAPVAPSSATESAFEAFRREDYRQAMLLGARALSQSPDNHELRLMVANSLSWNGRYEAAIGQYEKLFGTPLEASARVGIGNILRWRGLAHQAEPLHQRAVALAPKDEDAKKALTLTQRDLRTSTTAKYAHFDDNQGYKRNELQLNHRFWNPDRSMRFEVGGVVGRQGAAATQSTKELNGSVYLPGPMISTKVEASYARDTKSALFGRVSADFAGDVAGVRLGRVNWGKIVNNQQALLDSLTATQIGGYWNVRTLAGDWKGRADLYRISDSNKLFDAETSFKPSWQPLPAGIFFQGGLYTRKADRVDPRYWSPDKPYSLLTLGLGKNWWGDKTDVSVMMQRGFAINSDSKSNLSLSGTVRHWINNDAALGVEFYASDSPRPSSYRSNYLGLSFQQLW